MKLFSCITLILSFSIVCASQKIDNFVRLDEKSFAQQLEKLPTLVTKDRWGFFYQKTIEAFENEDYESAKQFISKARIIAEKLEENFLIGKSFRFAGKIETKLNQLSKASRSFEKASAFLQQVDDSPALQLEVGYLSNDWAQRFTNPDFIHDEIDFREASKFLFYVLKFTEDPKMQNSELKTLTLLNVANFFGIKGNYLTQIYWLEKANLSTTNKLSAGKYKSDVFSGLTSAYLKLGNMNKAEFYLKQLEPVTRGKRTPRLIYLRLLIDFYTIINSKLRNKVIDEGIELSKNNKDFNQLSEFYRTKMLTLLIDGRFDEAKKYIDSLEDLAKSGNYLVQKLDLFTAKGVIAGFAGQQNKSDELFTSAEKILIDEGNEWSNALFLFNWEAKTTNFQKRFQRLKSLCEKYLERAKSSNKQDFLPQIYFYLANAEFELGNVAAARVANQQAIALIENRRISDSPAVSTGTIDKLFEVYQQRIRLDLAEDKIEEGFYSAELLKSRWLTDRISKTDFPEDFNITEDAGNRFYNLSLSILEKPEESAKSNELIILEQQSLLSINQTGGIDAVARISNLSLSELENLPLNQGTALVSYSFVSNQKLIAFVIERGKKVRQIPIDLTVSDSEKMAQTVQNQIKNGIFFKEKAKEIYDILLKPLNLQSIKHLIIVPDKALWKIPFQVLSADVKKFLIEDYQITYAPSVSVLTKYLVLPKPVRHSFQVFSNARFNNLYLLFADGEAKSLADAFQTKPFLNSTIEEFTGKANQSDIVHFSMHAEIDEEDAFKSFLAFSKSANYPNGKLTVSDLLRVKLKQQSMVFLASCATDNVLNGEGLISLAWGMMNAGATTVISAQWEANDESTEQFTRKFYKYYRQGFSGAESLQKASIEMIRSSDNRFNKPYHWAEFTLNGDFR